MTFTFGNTHHYEEKGVPSRTTKKINHHRWISFVVANDLRNDTDLIIKRVTFNLHKTFQTPKVVVDKPPFICSRIGWGYFEVPIEIEFQPWVGLDKKVVKHMLHLEDKGDYQAFTITLNDIPENVQQKIEEERSNKH